MSKFSWKNVLIVSTIAGVIFGLVRLGWENTLPPKTSERNKTNPPQKLLGQMGASAKSTHVTYTYSGEKLPWVSYLVHFEFSIPFATAYVALLEKKAKWLTVDQGVPFGLAVWTALHLMIMPSMKIVPSPKDQLLEEHVSEALGHIAWMWTNNETVEVVLEQLRHNKKEH